MSLKRLLFLALIAAVCAAGLRAFAFEGIYVATGSMEPTLKVGTHLLLDKVALRMREPRRGEIVVFVAPVPPHEEMLKRVIAVGGDRVEMREKKVFLNGAELSEPFARHSRESETLRGDSFTTETVPEGSFFLLGDNRDESNDSSVWRDEDGNPIRFVRRSRLRGLVRGFY